MVEGKVFFLPHTHEPDFSSKYILKEAPGFQIIYFLATRARMAITHCKSLLFAQVIPQASWCLLPGDSITLVFSLIRLLIVITNAGS